KGYTIWSDPDPILSHFNCTVTSAGRLVCMRLAAGAGMLHPICAPSRRSRSSRSRASS
ncbi:unnamed protein product, partial [Mycena citricolor]